MQIMLNRACYFDSGSFGEQAALFDFGLLVNPRIYQVSTISGLLAFLEPYHNMWAAITLHYWLRVSCFSSFVCLLKLVRVFLKPQHIDSWTVESLKR